MGAATRNPEDLERHERNREIYGEIRLEPGFLESIEREGIINRVVINEEDTVISGHRRVEAAKQVGISEVPVIVKEFDSVLEERAEIVNSNKNRTKTFSQKMREAQELEKIEKARAKKRQGDRRDITQNFAASAYGESREKVATDHDWSRETYRKAKKVWDGAQEEVERLQEQVEKLDAGEQSIHGAYQVWEEWQELQEFDDPVEWEELYDRGPRIQYKSKQVFNEYEDELDEEHTFRKNLAILDEGWKEHGRYESLNFEIRTIFAYLVEENEYGSLSEYNDTATMVERYPGEEELEEYYWEKEWAIAEIAILTGTSHELVRYWMWQDGIPMKMGQLTESEKNSVKQARKEA